MALNVSYVSAGCAVVTLVIGLAVGLWNISSNVSTIKTTVMSNRETLESRTELFEEMQKTQREITRDISKLKMQMMTVVYVNKNHVIVRLADGETIRIPMQRIVEG
tara:strand:+ start:65 stop:382 length:318 start_codon:yes stop_codon:yes gene_type:complete